MFILGIDPGSIQCGLALIEKKGNQFKLHEEKTIKLSGHIFSRLVKLRQELSSFLDQHMILEAAIETVFSGINPKSLIVLCQARGVLLEEVYRRGIHLKEYSPREVKKAVGFKGSASKNQVQLIISNILGIKSDSFSSEDASDAAAIALCHGFQRKELRIIKE